MAAPIRRALPVINATGCEFVICWFLARLILCIVYTIARDMHSDLPAPSADALAHSDEFTALLRAEIQASGGAIPFSRYMELCLYAPGWGYYSAGASKFGASGDFVTSPELGSLFATTVAQSLAPVFTQLGSQARMLELGDGSANPACAAGNQRHGL